MREQDLKLGMTNKISIQSINLKVYGWTLWL